MKPQTGRTSLRLASAAALALTAIFSLAGCYEDEDDKVLASPTAGETTVSSSGSEWLDPDASEPPPLFVARATGSDPALFAEHFAEVDARFRESSRMVANRLVQLWHESRQSEQQSDLLDLMQSLAADQTATRTISLGSLVQQYRVLRGQGQDHDAAIKAALEEGR